MTSVSVWSRLSGAFRGLPFSAPKGKHDSTPRCSSRVAGCCPRRARRLVPEQAQATGRELARWYTAPQHPVDRRRLARPTRCRSTRARSSPARSGRTSTACGSSPRPQSGRGSRRSGRTLAEQVLVPYPIESALSGIQRHEDRMWYRRTFTVPSSWKGQRLVLHFGAVDYDAKVWVNGRQVATHRGGYDGFDVDVTDALHRQRPAGADRLGRGPHRRDRSSRSASSARSATAASSTRAVPASGGRSGWSRSPPRIDRLAAHARPADQHPQAHRRDRPDRPASTSRPRRTTARRQGRPGHRHGRHRAHAADPEPEALVAGQPVPLRPQGQAARPRQDGRPGRLVLRDALGRQGRRAPTASFGSR